MSESTAYIDQLPESPHTAEQLLSLLIDLISKTTDPEQLSGDVVEADLEIRLDPNGEDGRSYAARLTREWGVSIVVTSDEVYGRVLELAFFDRDEETTADLTAICGIDSESFTNALTRVGFDQRVVRGIHGERRGREYSRGSLRVQTQTRGEAGKPHEKISHECVTAVEIRRG